MWNIWGISWAKRQNFTPREIQTVKDDVN